jgi:hypothetical protein
VKVITAPPAPLCVTVPPIKFAIVKTGEAEKPLVNFRRSTSSEVGEPLMFFATVPCGIAL